MNLRSSAWAALPLALLLVCVFSLGQANTGLPPFAPVSGGVYDTVKISTGTILLNLPIRAKQGFNYSLASNIAVTQLFGQVLMTPTWSPSVMGGPSPAVRVLYTTDTTANCPGTHTQTDKLTGWFFVDALGTRHTFISIRVDTLQCFAETTTSTAYDGSGYTMVVTPDGSSATVYDRAGNKYYSPVNTLGISAVADPNGNVLSYLGSFSGSGGNHTDTNTYTDSFATTPMTEAATYANYLITKDTHTWNDAAGVPRSYAVNYSSVTVKTNFGCTYPTDEPAKTAQLATSITAPDGTYSIFYEMDPLGGGVTGRISKITFPSGAYITYTYAGGNNNSGLVCDSYGNMLVPVLTRTLVDTKGNARVWKYDTQSVSNSTVVTDPAGNDTVVLFGGSALSARIDLETQRQIFQGSRTGGTLLETVVTCYNGNTTSCPGASISAPVLEKDVYTTLVGMTSSSRVSQFYDLYGELTETKVYDFGATTPTYDTVTNYGGTYSAGTCNAIGNHINRVCYTTSTDSGGNVIAQTTFQYDSRGNNTSSSTFVGRSPNLTKSATFNTNGTVHVATDTNGTQTTYTYGDCNGLLPTNSSTTIGSVNLSQSTVWDCNGAVPTSTTDANGKTTTTNYVQNGIADPFYRPLNTVDAMTPGNTTYYTYTPTTFESALTFNSGGSTVDVLTTTDGFGRSLLKQTHQAPGSSNFDTVQYTYDLDGRLYTTSMPCSALAGSGCSTAITTYQYDGLSRPTLTTDGGSGTLAYTYTPTGTKYDVIVTSGPAPAGENAKSRQMEYDGLGRLTSVCEITSGSGSGSCAQGSPKTGYWTKYAYDTTTISGVVYGRMTVTQNAQGTPQQTRTFLYDGVSRLVSETNPENGATQYFYDTAPGTPGVACSGTYNGDLVKTYDANGNTTCHTYDGLHRVLSTTYTGPNSNGVNKYMVYDSATVNGVAMANPKGGLVEAYTAASQNGTKATDEGFSYSARGELADFYESTPQSGGYYHTAVTFYPDGGLDTLWTPGIPAITYGTVDGEGRPTTVSASSGQNPVTSVSYDNAGGSGRVLGATYGSGDSDSFEYYTNTGRLKKYTFTMNGQQEIGNLTWNTNGTLGNLTISDPFNSADNGQNCNYGYDDLARLGSVGCGSSWSQAFTYDPFANITKTGSISWQPGYSATTNRYTLGGTSYDSNGNLKNDTFHSYTWDANNRPVSIDSIGVTYDALGRQVEQNQSGTYYQTLYTPQGKKLAIMKGQTIQQAFVPLPGGATAEYLSWGLSHYRHPDWLGSDRLASSYQKSSTPITSAAYAPFGEPYATSGNGELSFTGANKDTDWLQYDFVARQYDPRQSRWISPDPAGPAAVDTSNPQSWNRYAYSYNNPLSNVDPTGTECVWDDGSYDSNDDPESGNAGACGKLGGQWVDHSYFAQNGLGDWSSDPNSDIANYANNFTTSVTVNTGSPDDVPLLNVSFHRSYCGNASAANLDYDTPRKYLSGWERPIDHITDRHIRTDIFKSKSKYTFQSNTTSLSEKQKLVKAMNGLIFSFGKQGFSGNNLSFDLTFPAFEDPATKTVYAGVGTDANNGFLPTARGNLIVERNCKTVVTSFTGTP